MKVTKATEVAVKPRIADIINAMKPGQSVLFNAIEFGTISTARTAVGRTNKRLGSKQYTLTTTTNGVTYTITRAKQ